MKNKGLKDFALCILVFAASAVLLTVIQPPMGVSLLAWVALVPFVLACSPDTKILPMAGAAFFISACYWLGNLYYVYPVTFWGWLAFCLYTALLWPLLAVSIRFCRQRKIPLFLVCGILFTGAERLQGLFLGGLYWRMLAHSQYANIAMIQIADIFGVAGVSFLVAMVNGLAAELIIAVRRGEITRNENLVKAVIVTMAAAATLFYGKWRINQSPDFIEQGPLVASVQTNVPQVVKESLVSEEITFTELLENSRQSAAAGAELIVWPETMVQAPLDSRILPLLALSEPAKVFDAALKEHAKDTAYILVGAYGGAAKVMEDWTAQYTLRYNSAFLYRPDGMQSPLQYNKIHLVPFGEVVPFKKSAPWLYRILMMFTPYDYDYSLDYGTEFTIFPIEVEKRTYNFGVMICYEDTVPKIARAFALDEHGKKRLDWLVNISNDGWFVRYVGGKVYPSAELAQHTAVCVFRAVENRIAVVRSVNTGISCLIDTLGNIKNDFQAGNLPNNAMARQGIAGWFADTVPIDKRTTFFSKFGQWLDLCCAIVLVLTAAATLWLNRKLAAAKGKKHDDTKNNRM